jgi:hypothetical protein
LKEYGVAQVLIGASAALLAGVLGIRYGLLESGLLPTDCGGSLDEGVAGWCGLKWLVVQSFIQQRLGWVSFACGLLAFASRRRAVAWGGWLTGLGGLVLYNFDLAAVGALLSLLVLAREAAQRGDGENEAGDEPADRLRVGRLG